MEKDKKKSIFIWRFDNKFVSLQRQSMFDYPVNIPSECRGEQARTDTTPFKSHLRVAFIFHISS